jgi:hypothetical protein
MDNRQLEYFLLNIKYTKKDFNKWTIYVIISLLQIDMKKYMFSIGIFYSDVTKGALNAVYD